MGLSGATPEKGPVGRKCRDLGGLGYLYGYCSGKSVYFSATDFGMFFKRGWCLTFYSFRGR